MYNFKRSFTALLGLLLLVGVVAAITPFKARGQQSPEAVTAIQDVRVVNPATNPVQTKIVNGTAAPIPTKIVNASNAPVLTRDIDEARAANNVTLAYENYSYVFKRVTSTGVHSDSEFVVPAGQTLIVTDAEWSESACSGCSGTTTYMSLEISPSDGNAVVYESHALFNDNGHAFSTDSMRTGFAVASGKTIHAYAGVNRLISCFLHGYLVPAS